ncbi:endolytic transglycosylase MltG [Candidatus Falkowbacteria bacterium]|nr:endolytic transglycosylase MltG [Candidatus Falkowbacteria bacterium]
MKKAIVYLIIILVLASIFILAYGYSAIYKSSLSSESEIFVIESGQGVKQIGSNLKQADFISSQFVFETYVWLRRAQSRFQAGEYELNKGLSIKELVDFFTGGNSLSKEQDIKIIEGWNAREIAESLEAQGAINNANDFLDKIKYYGSNTNGYDFLADKPAKFSLEGYLFPDTYRIYKDATIEDILKKMLDNFDSKLTPKTREDIKKSGHTIFEILTMASIIELEVPASLDRRMISDIFWKRVEAGMPLQSDATINYVTGKNEPSPSLDDLKVDSLYNTYLYPDLPPGPIGNPGVSAIEAAIYRTPNDYWFYLSKPNGETVYSKTHDEHVQNKFKYLK